MLSEYLSPFVRIGGYAIGMKGTKGKEEAIEAKNAIKILGGEITNIEEFKLPQTDMYRTIIIIEKKNAQTKNILEKLEHLQKNHYSLFHKNRYVKQLVL